MRKSALSRPFAQYFSPSEGSFGYTNALERRDSFSLPQRVLLLVLLLLFCFTDQGSPSNESWDETSTYVPPAIYSIPVPQDHDSLIQTPLSRKGGRAPNQARRGSTKPHWATQLLCMRTGLLVLLLELLVVESQFPHPPQTHRQATGDGHRRNGTILLHCQVQVFPLPLRFIAHGHVSGFHQQSPQQTIALLGDVPQSLPALAARVFLQQLQPVLASHLPPGRQSQFLQLRLSGLRPHPFLDSFIAGQRLQLVLRAGARLHQQVTMQHQLPRIALLRGGHPKPRKTVFLHQPQQQPCILLVRLGLARRRCSNAGRIAHPQFQFQFP